MYTAIVGIVGAESTLLVQMGLMGRLVFSVVQLGYIEIEFGSLAKYRLLLAFCFLIHLCFLNLIFSCLNLFLTIFFFVASVWLLLEIRYGLPVVYSVVLGS